MAEATYTKDEKTMLHAALEALDASIQRQMHSKQLSTIKSAMEQERAKVTALKEKVKQ